MFLANIDAEISYDILEMESGEENKNLDICLGLWEALSEYGADRKSLMINVGGGVITDLGGFVASTFKRGISFYKHTNFITSNGRRFYWRENRN